MGFVAGNKQCDNHVGMTGVSVSWIGVYREVIAYCQKVYQVLRQLSHKQQLHYKHKHNILNVYLKKDYILL